METKEKLNQKCLKLLAFLLFPENQVRWLCRIMQRLGLKMKLPISSASSFHASDFFKPFLFLFEMLYLDD